MLALALAAAITAGDLCASARASAPPAVHDLSYQDVAAVDGAPGSCRVTGVIDREIGFELRLPAADAWNGKFLAAGVGGQAGQVNAREMGRAVLRGYATASTDAGHKASDVHWLMGGKDRADDYAWRANHRLAQVGKAWTAAAYARPLAHAYFVGCSGGGRQALTEVQRFPADYDGVIAGAPGPKTPEMSARRMWEMLQHSAHVGLMRDTDWTRLAAAQVAQCDTLDGVKDGVIDDPAACQFDWAAVTCKPGETTGGCFTPAQVAFARTLYAPLHDEEGRKIDDGLWPGVPVHAALAPEPFTPGPAYLATGLFADGVHHDPNWDVHNFRIARDLPAVDSVMNLHADNPDLTPFARRGGRLIIYQGLADSLVPAQPTIDYYRAVEAHAGGVKKAQAFARLFLVPGMDHCLGGAGTDRFGQAAGQDGLARDPEHDLLSALDAWIEHGRAPEVVVADRVEDGRVVRSRPLCIYPARAVYDGHGDPAVASAFACRTPASESPAP